MNDIRDLKRLQNKGFEVIKKELHITLIADKDDEDKAKRKTLVLSKDDIAEVEELDSKDDKKTIRELRQELKTLKEARKAAKDVLKKRKESSK